jgi:hypothetical protein
MLKRKRFLKESNRNKILTTLYEIHVNSGGTRDIEKISKELIVPMKEWKQLEEMERYESLVHDPIVEIEMMNKMFVKDFRFLYELDGNKNTITRTHELRPEDYGQLDLHNGDSKDVDVSASMYRFNNTIPIYQASGHNRQYDLSNDGLKYKSTIALENEKYDMQTLYDTVDTEYSTIDQHTPMYYGDPKNNNTALTMTNTGFGSTM